MPIAGSNGPIDEGSPCCEVPFRGDSWQRCAVIDVGTNSVKLLVADVSHGEVIPLLEKSEQTRLGRGFYAEHRLATQAIEETARVVADYARSARSWAVRRTRVVATSAARDAVNQSELLEAIRRTSELSAEVISGEQEAEWAFQGIASDPRFAGRSLLLLEVGGGSTQFVYGRQNRLLYRHSFRLGTVRFLESHPPHDPPTPEDWELLRRVLDPIMEHRIMPQILPILRKDILEEVVLVGTGGTCSLLASISEGLGAFDRQRIESVVFSHKKLLGLRKRLWSQSLAERKNTPGLPSNKADVILTGSAIYERAMAMFHLEPLHISTRGFRFGALADFS